jgi:hypothetical protein
MRIQIAVFWTVILGSLVYDDLVASRFREHERMRQLFFPEPLQTAVKKSNHVHIQGVTT